MPLNIQIKVAEERDNDIVILPDGRRVYFIHWLNRMKTATATLRFAFDHQQISPEARAAHFWMKLNGICTMDEFVKFETETLPKLVMPADSRRATTRCSKCGSLIWGRESLLTGVGSECRRKEKRVRNNTRRARQMLMAA